ncbi:nicotinate-nucleotide--dimethylbenzimidazole phosphoribosyltransferase [Mesorhizobium sp. NBSH29]|uniref:nicotinate-nucleotide--dimethylbenzimidazole phosphoribosyltransferase n=1 Tax=Mesorhizobium sp. NBSH29 TaxID=2654249 RepID=UPI0018964AFC|nr:nicotinate-nucleotide--dimethylbenzimidazole phosphoribosyltransferase [Mesorhizobium sp. NBSH29]QPC86658.1 nicotinate-nucleotide--dimethylbenzimidazole phosphoribosyltransferase [Mesorhizobium sp. NBSH29]
MSQFKTLADLRAACAHNLPEANQDAVLEAEMRQNSLTKPQGSLGRLEEIVAWLAAWQGRSRPTLDQVSVIVFAGSHGITAQGVSAFPAEVTHQMVANFEAGGAAINQLARVAGADLKVVALNVAVPTGDFTQGPAMDEAAFLAAVNDGYASVSTQSPKPDLLCFGEMGIGNTTTAAAVAAGLFGEHGERWVGRGTGVDDQGLARKAMAVDAGLAQHAAILSDPLAVAANLGGRELAAILGATLAARHLGIPVVMDGFVVTAAMAPLAKLHPRGLGHVLAAHVSAETPHRRLLELLGKKPLFDFDMRLGEGSGAALAVPVIRAALACFTGMASFAEAGVSEG